MAKVKNLGLYVGLLCIIGILTVFSFDAYIGIYDVLYTEQDGWEREIAFDEPYPEQHIGTRYGKTTYLRYEIVNHGFKEYSTYIEASVWRDKEKKLTLFSADKSIKPFGNITLDWVLKSEELEPNTNYILKIKTDDFERTVRMTLYK